MRKKNQTSETRKCVCSQEKQTHNIILTPPIKIQVRYRELENNQKTKEIEIIECHTRTYSNTSSLETQVSPRQATPPQVNPFKYRFR